MGDFFSDLFSRIETQAEELGDILKGIAELLDEEEEEYYVIMVEIEDDFYFTGDTPE